MNKLFKSFFVGYAAPHTLDVAFAIEEHERRDRPDAITAPEFLRRVAVERVRRAVLTLVERVQRI